MRQVLRGDRDRRTTAAYSRARRGSRSTLLSHPGALDQAAQFLDSNRQRAMADLRLTNRRSFQRWPAKKLVEASLDEGDHTLRRLVALASLQEGSRDYRFAYLINSAGKRLPTSRLRRRAPRAPSGGSCTHCLHASFAPLSASSARSTDR